MILHATPSRTVEDFRQEAKSKNKHEIGDPYVTFEGKVLRGSDEMRSCGISNGSMVQMIRRVLGAGGRKNKELREMSAKGSALKTEPQLEQNAGKPEDDQGSLIQERAEDEVTRHFEESGLQKLSAFFRDSGFCDNTIVLMS